MFIPLFKIPQCCNSGVEITRDAHRNNPIARCECKRAYATTWPDYITTRNISDDELARLCIEWNTYVS